MLLSGIYFTLLSYIVITESGNKLLSFPDSNAFTHIRAQLSCKLSPFT